LCAGSIPVLDLQRKSMSRSSFATPALRRLVKVLRTTLVAALLPCSARAEGGPDAFGYTWSASTDPGGPDYEWIDISQTGSPLQLGESGYGGPIPLNFPFPFYGDFYSSCYITANGIVAFGGGAGTANGQCLPSAQAPNNLIALLWEDLHPISGASVRFLQDAANQRLIFQFHQILGSCGQPINAQVILLPGGVIRLQYQSLPTACATAAAIGIENADGSIGLRYHCASQGGEVATAGLALQFVPPSPCDELDCVGITEVEPNNGWEDGHSNPIAGGQTLCGSLEANAQTVDSDALLYRHFGGDITATLATEDFNGRLRLCEVDPGGAVLAVADQLPRCYDEALHLVDLPAGFYLLVVDHDGVPDVEGVQGWSLSLHGEGHACSEHVPVQCVGEEEVEPNAGWTADPPNSSLGRIQPGLQVCGSIQADAQGRDMDWFQLDLAAPADVQVELVPDAFDAVLYFTDLDPDGSVLDLADSWRMCLAEHLTLPALAAGSYCVVVASQHQEEVPEAQHYVLQVAVADSSSLCLATPVEGLEVDEVAFARPAPLSRHMDGALVEGGIASPGRDDVFTFHLDQPADVEATFLAQGEADEVLLLFGDCQETSACLAAVDAHASGPEGETLLAENLPAGSYWLVADFAQADGAAPYSLNMVARQLDLQTPAPRSFALDAPHPNPFNPATTLVWTQSTPSAVRLVVHDLRGACVAEYALGQLPAGRHQFQWDGSALSSGLYLFTLQVGHGQETRKALLLK